MLDPLRRPAFARRARTALVGGAFVLVSGLLTGLLACSIRAGDGDPSEAGAGGAYNPGRGGAGTGGTGGAGSAGLPPTAGRAGVSGQGSGGGSSASVELLEAPTPFVTEGLHVSVSGNDASGDGSAAAPYRTIQYVLDNVAAPGGVILVHAGRYEEQVRIRHSNFTLQAASASERPLVTCPVSGDENSPPICVEIDAETTGVTLRGLEVSGGFYSIYLGSQWDYDSTPLDNPAARGVTIEDCIVHDSGRDTIKLPAGCDDVTIRRCEIYNSGMSYPAGTSPEDKNAEGIDVVNSDRLRVADTFVHDAATSCVYVKGGSIGTVIERVRAERCGDVGIALGFDTSPEFFDPQANPGYYENLGGTVRNCVVRDTGLAGIGLFASRDARVLHNTVVRAATRGQAALYLGVATQDYAPEAKRPANVNPTIVGNVVDQTGVADARCFGIRYSVEDELGILSGLDGAFALHHNLYFAGGAACAFSDSRPAPNLEGGDLAAWQAHGAGFDVDSSFQSPALDAAAHLAAGSPAVDALSAATEGVSYDIDRQPRQAPYDLGADER